MKRNGQDKLYSTIQLHDEAKSFAFGEKNALFFQKSRKSYWCNLGVFSSLQLILTSLGLPNRGVFRSILGDMQLAVSDFNESIKLNNNYLEAYLERGNVHKKLGNNNLAIQDFQKSYDIAKKLNNRKVQDLAQKAIKEIQTK